MDRNSDDELAELEAQMAADPSPQQQQQTSDRNDTPDGPPDYELPPYSETEPIEEVRLVLFGWVMFCL
jgi:hypothetical protein